MWKNVYFLIVNLNNSISYTLQILICIKIWTFFMFEFEQVNIFEMVFYMNSMHHKNNDVISKIWIRNHYFCDTSYRLASLFDRFSRSVVYWYVNIEATPCQQTEIGLKKDTFLTFWWTLILLFYWLKHMTLIVYFQNSLIKCLPQTQYSYPLSLQPNVIDLNNISN